MRRNGFDLQVQNLVPIPEVARRAARSTEILLQGRLDQNHIELHAQVFEVKRFKISFQIHRRCGCLRDQLVLQPNQLAQFRVFLESVRQSNIPYEVLWSLAGVDEMLAVIVVRI